MVQIFQILAVVLAGVAAIFFWKENSDWAFASAVLAVCSFFLSIRFQFKARLREREEAVVAAEAEDEAEDQGEESSQ